LTFYGEDTVDMSTGAPVLPLHWRMRTSDLKLFHTLPSLNLAPYDFWLFVALKKHLKGIHFTRDAEVPAATGKWFQEQPEEFYSDGFKKPIQHWQLCIK
jgi:hypothetical protein